MKRFISEIALLCIFTAGSTYAGNLNFSSGVRIQSYQLSVPQYAAPVVVNWCNHGDNRNDLLIGDGDGNVWQYINSGSVNSPAFAYGGSKIEGVNVEKGRAIPCVIDWDGKYYLDLIVGDAAGKLTLFLSNSMPAELSPPTFGEVIPTGIEVRGNAAPYVCNWNDGEGGDNLEDLIIGDANGNVWVYLNEGTQDEPQFSQGYLVLAGTTTLSVGNDAVPQVVQWDGIGNKDLVVGNKAGEIYLFLSTNTSGTPTFSTEQKIQANNKDIDVGDNAAPFIVNWDNLGNIDLVIGEKDGSLNLYRNLSDKPPVFSIPSKIASVPTDLNAGSRVIPHVLNFNNDGAKDMVVGDGNGNVKLYLNSGNDNDPKFSDAYTFQVDAGTLTGIVDLAVGDNASPYVYDWDGNSIKDLIVGDSQGFIYIFINSKTDDSPLFKPGTRATTGTGTNQPLQVTGDATPIITDWNNDGLMDLLVGENYGYVNLFLNSGTNQKPVFLQSPQRIKADGTDITVPKNAKPYIVDFNGDNRKDLIIGSGGEGKYGYVYVYLNVSVDDKSPAFTTNQSHYFQLQANSVPLEVSGYAAPIVMNWNNDNILDLIVGEKDGYINLYTGSFENSAPVVLCDTPVGTQTKDVTIKYLLQDDENNPCSIVVVYSTDGGYTWITASAVANAGDGMSNLNSSKEGVNHSFVWNSSGDLGGVIRKVIIKIIPYDAQVEGKPGKTGEFWVDNATIYNWQRIKLDGADLNINPYSSPIVIDWDEDGRDDLLVGGENGYVYFCKNIGSNQSPEFNVAVPLKILGGNLLHVDNYASPFVCNWNSSGKKDLLVGDKEGYVTFFENTGNYLELAIGKKIQIGTSNLKLFGGYATPVVTYYNGDSYKDLLAGDRNGNVYLYLNKNVSPQEDTSPLLSPEVKIQGNSDLDVGNNAAPFIIDWDNDGHEDLIIGNEEGFVFFYKNLGANGTPSFKTGSKIKLDGAPIKVNANARPGILKQNEDTIDLIVGSKAGYVFLYRLTDVVRNTPPQMTITNPKGSQSTQTGSVTITYTLQDDDWNKCIIKVEYSTDGQYWYSATGTPKSDLESTPEGTNQTFTWFSKEDIIATKTYIYLRLIPNDGIADGPTATISFYLRNRNKLPIITNVTTKPVGQLGQIEISYDLYDQDSDFCRVFVEYQGGSVTTWATATVIGTTIDILPATGLKLIWLSSVDERHKSAKNYQIKVTPFDIEYGTSGISTIFEIDNSSLSSGIVPARTITTLSFSPTTIELLESFSNDYDVLITVEENPTGILPMNTIASLNNTVRKISAFKLPDITPLDPPSVDAKITIPYDDLNSYEQEMLLKIFELRENKWVVVGGTPDVVNNRVTVQVEHFSVFRIGLYAATLNEFSISPNPFKDNDGVLENGELGAGGDYEVITFMGVNKVEIYTIAGELVRESKNSEIDYSGWRWNLRNDAGKLVSSGIYIYVAYDSSGASVVGKLGVIR
ncbi:MAG: VCBS repeat-containing protein [bacterium]